MVMENLGQALLSIDFLATGFILLTESLFIALALVLSNDNMKTFMAILGILNGVAGLGIFVGIEDSIYLMAISIIIFVYMILPNNTISNQFGK